MLVEYSSDCYEHITCTDPEGFFSEGSNFDNIFFIYLCVFIVDEGRDDPDTTISEPSSALKRNAFKWRFAGAKNKCLSTI